MTLDVWQEINLRCNLRCSFCYNEFQPESLRTSRWDELDEATAIAIFSRLSRVQDLGRITLAGGEPLLHDRCCELVRIAKNYAKECAIVSNGTVLNESRVFELKNAGIDLVQVSLHGGTAERHDSMVGKPGSYKRVMKTLHLLRDQGVAFGLSYVWENQDDADLVAVVEIASIYDAEFVVIGQVRNCLSNVNETDLVTRKRRFLTAVRRCDEKVASLGIPIILATYLPNSSLANWPLLAVTPVSQLPLPVRLHVDCVGNVRMCLSSSSSIGNVLEQDCSALVDQYILSTQNPNGKDCHCALEARILDSIDPPNDRWF